MSQDQNGVIQAGPPKRFLRKGEGLKRFAAYKPPLPATAKKVERRQTFVRFKLDRSSAIVTKETVHFIPPEILNDDSINLSTEIPKIAPPKIIHTPIRPNRNALGTLTNESSLFTDSQINGNIDNLFRKIEEKESALREEEGNCFFGDDTVSFNCKEHDQRKDDNKALEPDSRNTQLTKRDKCSSARLDSPSEELRVSKPKHTVKPSGRASPVPDSSVLELTKHIEKIESSVNELREKLKNCECCVSSPPQPIRKRPTTRAAARAAKSKAIEAKPAGLSADADKITTKERLDILANEFAQLRAKLDATHSRH